MATESKNGGFLNLPAYGAKVRRDGEMVQIFDALRGRWVKLTPEEWVRQHFVHYLTEGLGYPSAMMANEVALEVNGTRRRCDSVVYERGSLRPLMIVEYKAPEVRLTQRVFDQICRYNMTLEVEHLIVSNGLRHFCCRVDLKEGSYAFMERIPRYEELCWEGGL